MKKGSYHSEATKLRIKLSAMGNTHGFQVGHHFNKGIKKSKAHRDKIRKTLLGNVLSETTKKKMRKTALAKGFGKWMSSKTGSKGNNWKGGISKDKNHIRYLGQRWNRQNIEERRLFTRKRRVLRINAEGSHTLNEWKNLKESFQFTCLRCQKQEPEIILTEDHIIPLSKGGSDNITNIQPLCRICNSTKHTKIINYIQNYES